MTKFVYNMLETIVGEEENAGYQHFPLFPQCFPFVDIISYDPKF